MRDGRLVREELSGSKAKGYVSRISGFHRIQGSRMYHDAAVFIVDELGRMGVKDAEILQFPADGRRWYWNHQSSPGWEVRGAELRLVEPRDELLASYADIPMSLHTHSRGTPKGGVTAELVDVGVGTSSKDYRGKDVKDKLVLATGKGHAVQMEAVVKRGAAGVVTDKLSHEFAGVRESSDIPDAHSYQSIWPTAETVKKTRFGFSLSKRQGERLRKYLANGQKVVLRAEVDAETVPGKYEVVTAVIKGSSRPDEEVLLVAHLCHPKPGANDNASGSGMLMEIARTLTALIRDGRIKRPARSIRFLWVPETTGTVAFLSSRKDIWSRFIAAMNLDMVGSDQEACRCSLHITLTPGSLPSYMNGLVMWAMEDSAKALDPLVRIGLVSNFRYAASTFTSGSDHAELVVQPAKVPCVSFTQWPDRFYHSSMDTIDRVSEESLARVGWTCTTVALTVADADERVAAQLASLACSRGLARMAEASAAASQDIHSAAEGPKGKDQASRLEGLARRHRSRMQHIVMWEQEAVRSVLRLGTSKELESIVDGHVADLREAGERCLAGLSRTVASVGKSLGVKVGDAGRDTAAEKDARRVVPRPLFKGTLPWSLLTDSFDEKHMGAYDRLDAEDPDFMSKRAELINLIDARRTVYDIAESLSAEYGPTSIAHVMKHLRDLEKLHLVSMERSKKQ